MMKTVKVGNRSFSMKRVRTFSPAEKGFDQEGLAKKYPKAMSALVILTLAHQANPLKALLAIASGKRQYDEKFTEKLLADAEKFIASMSDRRFSKRVDEEELLEAILGSQGDLQINIMRYCVKGNHKLSDVLSLAKKLINTRKESEDWGNFEYADKKNILKSLEIKNFSQIDSPESFREYAHKVMKAAHGEEYSEEATNKVVDDLLKNNQGADYGELIGRLTSGFND